MSNQNYTSGLVNYWPFAGSLKDLITRNDLIVISNQAFVSLSSDQYGNAISAIHFNQGQVLAPNGVYFDCTTGYTITTWIKLDAYNTDVAILEFSNKNNNQNSVIVLFEVDKIRSTTRLADNTGWTAYADSTSTVSLNVWTHIAVTVNTNINLVYFNGQQVASAAGGQCGSGIERTFCVIGNWFGNPYYLKGALDELKIFNRMLSQSEIVFEMSKPQPFQIVTATLVNVYAPPTAYTSGLTNYWPFSGNTADVIGGKNLTLQSNAQYDLDRLGNSNAALYFNLGWAMAPAGRYFDCRVDYTAMLWIKLISYGSNNPRIFSFHNSGSNVVSLYYSALTGQVGTRMAFATSNIVLQTGVWAHVAFTTSSSSNIIYINGQQVFADSFSCAPAVSTANCYIGRSESGPGDTDLNAVIDEFKIFNQALTPSQIVAEMKLPEPYNKIIFN